MNFYAKKINKTQIQSIQVNMFKQSTPGKETVEYELVSQDKVAMDVGEVLPLMKPTTTMGRYFRTCWVFTKIVINVVSIIMMLIITMKYANQPRACPYHTVQECYSDFIADEIFIKVRLMFKLASYYSIALFVGPMLGLLYKLTIIAHIVNLVGMVAYYHNHPDFYDYSYMYSESFLFSFFIQIAALYLFYGLIRLGWRLRSNRPMVFVYIIIVVILLSSPLFWLKSALKPNKFWHEGINGIKALDKDENGNPYCEIKTPKEDWLNVFGGLGDMTFLYRDCTKYPFTEQDKEYAHAVLEEYYNDFGNGKYLAFPNFKEVQNHIKQKFNDVFKRAKTQEYMFENAKSFDKFEDIPDEYHQVLDTDNMTYIHNIKRNHTLVNERDELREEFLNKWKQKVRKGKPAKNIIVIYVDAFSRIEFMKKWPKMIKWMEDYKRRMEDELTLYQGIRAHNVASFTYHNVLAYYYGVVSERQMFKNSPYTVTEGVTNVQIETVEDAKTHKKKTKKVLKGGLFYNHFIHEMENSGMITGQSATDCATSPLTQEGSPFLDYIEQIKHDYNGIAPGCDPNFFYPKIDSSRGLSPYAVVRRCLYGQEMIDYATDFAKKFMTVYEDKPKFYQLELMEAHENTQEVIHYQDEKVVEFMKWLEANGHLKDSAFLLLSDHGFHMSPYIPNFREKNFDADNAFQIQILLISSKLLSDADKLNLKRNEQVLTTLFEVYYFLRYLTDMDKYDYFQENSLVSPLIPTDRDSKDLYPLDSIPQSCIKPSRKLPKK